jgi:agmatinase
MDHATTGGQPLDPRLTAFCPSEFGMPPLESCRFQLLPVPLERSVSYGAGTAQGPSAILRAADELEPVYRKSIPGKAGVFVQCPLDCTPSKNVTALLGDLEKRVAQVVGNGHIPILLGGEHTLTQAGVAGVIGAHRDSLGLIQLDAHADLRNEYGGDPLSHASVVRRLHERFSLPVLQIGVRGMAVEEAHYRKANNFVCFDGPELAHEGYDIIRIPDSFPQSVYLTLDVDVFDASLMPATGTPSPGGITWNSFELILDRIVASGRKIVGLDIVELSPIAGFHAAEFTVAAALYACMRAALMTHGELEANDSCGN